jgi:hypothetical protein
MFFRNFIEIKEKAHHLKGRKQLKKERGERYNIPSDNLGGHGSLGDVEQGVLGKVIDGDSQSLCDVFDGLLAGEPKTIDDGCWVDFTIHELICPLLKSA